MIGLGSSIAKPGKIGKRIVRDGLVLKHDYNAGAVETCSSGAASFTASNTDYIDVGNACNLGTGDFSISCWIWTSDVDDNAFISKYEDGDDQWFMRIGQATNNNDGKIQFHSVVTASGDEISGVSGTRGAIKTNEWTHLAITNDRSDTSAGLKFYINGVADGTAACSTINMDNTGSLYFSRYINAYYSNYLCNVGIWSAALTQAQVKSIMLKDYASLSASEKTSLVSWWNLDSTLGSYTGFSETDASPSTMSNLVLDSANQGLTAVTVSNSNFTSGSGTSITNWTNESDQWTKVGNTVVSGTTKKLLYQNVLTANTAHKSVIRARRTSGSAGVAELSCYFGGNNFAFVTLTDDFVDYEFHGLQDNNTILYLHNKNGDVTVDSVEVYIHDGNTGNLL